MPCLLVRERQGMRKGMTRINLGFIPAFPTEHNHSRLVAVQLKERVGSLGEKRGFKVEHARCTICYTHSE